METKNCDVCGQMWKVFTLGPDCWDKLLLQMNEDPHCPYCGNEYVVRVDSDEKVLEVICEVCHHVYRPL